MPVQVAPNSTCAEAVERMTRGAADSVLVVGSDGAIRGIVTEQDVTRRIAFQRAGDAPIETVMTAQVRTIRERDYLYHAIAYMRRSRLRHMPVVDDGGQVVGLLNLDEALAASSEQLVGLINRLTHEETLAGLKEVKTAQVEVADALFGDGVPAPEIQALISEINLDIYRRVIALSVKNMREAGWGEPPVEMAAIVMGSGGRGESYLFPDQDNGFILGDYPDNEHNRIDAYYIELADRMTVMLDKVGIPLCRGNVMATNPVWRKTVSQWRRQIDIWMRKRSDVAIRLADIFFDFRAGFGEPALAQALREHVSRVLPRSPAFLRDMYGLEADHSVALGIFGHLRTETRPQHRGKWINLKYQGSLPLVEGVRLYALRAGIADTSTLERIDALHGKGILSDNEEDYLTGAFRLITDLLLRQQIADFKAGREVGNLVPEAALTRREKDMLIDCFRAISRFRDRIKNDITGEIF
jgi:signal-transduction protein with cAMP-binding, CBS, and nucleotidyltransferase domain